MRLNDRHAGANPLQTTDGLRGTGRPDLAATARLAVRDLRTINCPEKDVRQAVPAGLFSALFGRWSTAAGIPPPIGEIDPTGEVVILILGGVVGEGGWCCGEEYNSETNNQKPRIACHLILLQFVEMQSVRGVSQG